MASVTAIRELYTTGLLAYALGIAGGLAGHSAKRAPAWIPGLLCVFSLAGALLEFGASLGALFANTELSWSLASGVPYLSYAVRLDPLSAYFNLALSLLAASVSVYSLGYIAHSPARNNPGLFCFFLNLLLLSLTLVFTASNILFFLIVWELMAVSAYFLVVFDHESAETRKGGLLYLLMSRGGSAMLLVGFLLLASAAGSMEFPALHGLGERLPPFLGAIAFLLLFFGFGVKAGIIPLHI
jgi:hydrogenase-4 component B